MAVPATIRKRHDANACFDEPPREQQMLVNRRRSVELILVRLAVAIALTNSRVFLRQIERVGQTAGGQHVERAGREAIERLDLCGRIDIAMELVEASKQFAAILKLIKREPLQRHVLSAVAIGLERRERRTEEAGLPRIRPA